MALNRTSSSNLANLADFEQRGFGAIPVEGNQPCSSLLTHVSSLDLNLNLIEELLKDPHPDKVQIAQMIQRMREKTNSLKVSLFQSAGNNNGGYGSPLHAPPTFYTSANGGPVEVEPAPEFRSAEGLNPMACSQSPVINPALRIQKKKSRIRDRKKKPSVAVQVAKIDEDGKMPDDGYSWRKYGSKNIKTAVFKRSYYRCNSQCSQNRSKKCRAKKTVQQFNSDPSLLQIVYDPAHTCKVGPDGQPQDSLAEKSLGAEDLDLADDMLKNDSIANTISPDSPPNWQVHVNDFNTMRTSSGNFSGVIEEEIDEAVDDALATLGVNPDSSLSDLIDSAGWPSEIDAENHDLKGSFVEDDDGQLLSCIISGHSTGSDFAEQGYDRNMFMSQIGDWHWFGKGNFGN
ncbi:hypothetical protein R1sor_012070 [Riccia sorocarpa]|uniref:WRKY domain-containing protein n=1 Tax=Riccia sorocarpa TaxID=122646 RepID=A0ABD3I640_9MARC